MKRILVVDHDEITLDLTNKFLTNFGYEVECCLNSKEALAKLDGPQFDLIVSEVEMPGLNGFDLIKMIERCQIEVPIVFLTNQDDYTTRLEARHAGVERLISKKNDFINLPHILDNILYQGYKLAM
ncbi:MAG: response regulator [Flavobacteriales bacterium]|nr:response regulator [Flavobacteriales bacterium]